MNRISRYLFRECGFSTLAALLVLTFVVMLPQVLRLVDFWVNKGVSVTVLGHMILLSLPQVLVAAIPMALLIGTLLTLGRLAQESELVILKACGISLYQVMRPVALLALLYTLLALLLNMVWLPYAFHQFSVLKKALISASTLALKSQTFNHTLPGVTIYIGEQDAKNNVLNRVLVHDQRNKAGIVTLTARRGQIAALPNGGTLLSLQDGTRHQKIGEHVSRELIFSTYNMDLGVDLELQAQASTKHLDEMSPGALYTLTHTGHAKQAYAARMEWHRRLAFPVATFILGIFAVPLGMQQSHRSGRSYGFIVAVLTLITHFFLLSLGEAMANKHVLDPLVGFWLPNTLMLGLTGYVTFITHRGRPLGPAVWLAQMLAQMPQKLLRPTKEPR